MEWNDFGLGVVLIPVIGQPFWWTTGFTVLAVLASFFLPGRRVPAAGQPTVPAQGHVSDRLAVKTMDRASQGTAPRERPRPASRPRPHRDQAMLLRHTSDD